MKNSLKIATAQLNPKVGDLLGNMEKILSAYNQAAADGADLVVTSECSLTGYPLEDLTRNTDFLEDVHTTLAQLRTKLNDDVGLIVGAPMLVNNFDGSTSVYNTAFLLEKNSIQYTVKHELPNYGVFDEKRNFNAGDLSIVEPLTFKGFKLGVLICEDTWFNRVSNVLAKDGAQVLISINGSPFEQNKQGIRYQVVGDRVEETGLACVYVNQVGGQDNLVFDGSSFIVALNGKEPEVIWQGERFKEEIKIHDFFEQNGKLTNAGSQLLKNETISAVYDALILGLRDYYTKTGIFKGVVIGLSGGIDSALVATIATDAFGPDKVHCVRLPSKYSSQHSLDDAEDLAKNLGVKLSTINIQHAVDAVEKETSLQDIFNDAGKTKPDVTEENIQSRIRANFLLAISNKLNYLMLNTGNRSESLVGYFTLGGDSCGGISVLKDLYKTTIFEICKWRNENTSSLCLNNNINIIPSNTITKPPSAELSPDQKDTDSLPDYDMLDYILYQLVDLETPSELIINEKISSELVSKIKRMVFTSEFKRRQCPPGIKISGHLLDKDRRYPIINGWK